jgi:hypothetical protein
VVSLAKPRSSQEPQRPGQAGTGLPQAARGAEPDRDGAALTAATIAAVPGACFSAFGIISNWQPPWPQFVIFCPAFLLVFGGLRYSYDVRRRRTPSRDG